MLRLAGALATQAALCSSCQRAASGRSATSSATATSSEQAQERCRRGKGLSQCKLKKHVWWAASGAQVNNNIQRRSPRLRRGLDDGSCESALFARASTACTRARPGPVLVGFAAGKKGCRCPELPCWCFPLGALRPLPCERRRAKLGMSKGAGEYSPKQTCLLCPKSRVLYTILGSQRQKSPQSSKPVAPHATAALDQPYARAQNLAPWLSALPPRPHRLSALPAPSMEEPTTHP